MITIQHILVPVDFSDATVYAARYAATLAQAHQAKLYVLHVKAPFPVHGRMAAGALEHVQKHRIQKEQSALVELIPASVKGSIDVEEIQVTGMPLARVIVAKARELAVDVIVIPAQKQKGWMRFFKPNILQQVMQAAPCSVFAVCPPQSPNDPLKP